MIYARRGIQPKDNPTKKKKVWYETNELKLGEKTVLL